MPSQWLCIEIKIAAHEWWLEAQGYPVIVLYIVVVYVEAASYLYKQTTPQGYNYYLLDLSFRRE